MLANLLTSILAIFAPTDASIKLPVWAQSRWKQTELSKSFRFGDYAKPSFLLADFNGDKKIDVAILVTRRTTGSHGILILQQGLTPYYVLGTGPNTHPNIQRGDFSWVDHWNLYTRSTAEETIIDPSGDLESRIRRLKRPAIEITKEESDGGLIYWNGKQYIWINQTC